MAAETVTMYLPGHEVVTCDRDNSLFIDGERVTFDEIFIDDAQLHVNQYEHHHWICVNGYIMSLMQGSLDDDDDAVTYKIYIIAVHLETRGVIWKLVDDEDVISLTQTRNPGVCALISMTRIGFSLMAAVSVQCNAIVLYRNFDHPILPFGGDVLAVNIGVSWIGTRGTTPEVPDDVATVATIARNEGDELHTVVNTLLGGHVTRFRRGLVIQFTFAKPPSLRWFPPRTKSARMPHA